MNIKVKMIDSLKGIELGSMQDDAIYYRFLLGKGSIGHKLIADIKADKKYICTLQGENDIINFKGENVTGADQYLVYADSEKNGRDGFNALNFNHKAYLCLEDPSIEQPGRIFSSIGDIVAYFENK